MRLDVDDVVDGGDGGGSVGVKNLKMQVLPYVPLSADCEPASARLMGWAASCQRLDGNAQSLTHNVRP